MDGMTIVDATNRRIRSYRSIPGYVICLCCQRKFHSPDRTYIRVCGNCKSGRERTGIIGESSVIVHGIDIIERDVFADDV